MKRSPLSFLRLTILILLILISKLSFSQYKISQIIESNKIKIPYKYDGFIMKEFTFGLVNKTIPIEFMAFKGQKYKLIFCSSDFDESVTINIYDKSAPSVIIATKMLDAGSKDWTFEPAKPGTYSIVYEIPPSETGIEHKACMVMLIGFKGK